MHKIIDHFLVLDHWIDQQPVPVKILVYTALMLILTAPMKPLVIQIQEWRAPPVIEIQYDGNPNHLT